MTNEIYATVAAQFYEWGVSPLPLEPYNPDDPESTNPKKPIIPKWQKCCRQLMAEKRVKNYCQTYPDNNIGIALGAKLLPSLHIAALDLDDDRLIPLVEVVLGKVICAKCGKKGKTIFVMAPEDLKSKKIKLHGEARPCIEYLANGTQTVMPPSIHAGTGKPYFYLDVCKPLYEYAPEELPQFTVRMLSLLDCICSSEHAAAIITSSGGTHDATLKLAGQLVASGFSKEEILDSVPAIFPHGYNGNSIAELPGMIDDAFEKGFDKVSSSQSIDAAAAKAIIAEENPFIYTRTGNFLKYDSGYWRKIEKSTIEQKALCLVEKMYEHDAVAPMIKHTVKCIEVFALREIFGKRSNLICCNNGTVDVMTGELLEHSPDHELLYRLDIDYDPNAECPTYDEHIRRTLLDDEQAIAIFDEFVGYTMIPDNRYQKALYLIGEGGSGKSTLLKVVLSIHDPNAYSVTPLTKIDNERNITDISDKLLCVSIDVQPKDRAQAYGEAFIRITGGDPITTRRLYKEVQGNVQTTV